MIKNFTGRLKKKKCDIIKTTRRQIVHFPNVKVPTLETLNILSFNTFYTSLTKF